MAVEYPRIDAFYDDALDKWVAVNLDNPDFLLTADTVTDLIGQLAGIGCSPFGDAGIPGLPASPLDKEIPVQIHYPPNNRTRKTYRTINQESGILGYMDVIKKLLAEFCAADLIEDHSLWTVKITTNEHWKTRRKEERHRFKFEYWFPSTDLDSHQVNHDDIKNIVCAYCSTCECLRQLRSRVIPDFDLSYSYTENLVEYLKIHKVTHWRIRKIKEIAPLAEEREELRKAHSKGGKEGAKTRNLTREYPKEKAQKLFDKLLPSLGYTETIKAIKARLSIPRSTLGDWFPKKNFR